MYFGPIYFMPIGFSCLSFRWCWFFSSSRFIGVTDHRCCYVWMSIFTLFPFSCLLFVHCTRLPSRDATHAEKPIIKYVMPHFTHSFYPATNFRYPYVVLCSCLLLTSTKNEKRGNNCYTQHSQTDRQTDIQGSIPSHRSNEFEQFQIHERQFIQPQ